MHSLIIGITGSGKTTLAKQQCAKAKLEGVKTIVLDPMMDKGWECDFITDSKEEFLQVVKQSTGCKLFVDESGQTVGKYNLEMEWLATQARHWGHKTTFITQRAQQISPTVRDQCSILYVFLVSKKDSDTFAEEFVQDELKNASSLKKFEFYRVGRFIPAKKYLLTLK